MRISTTLLCLALALALSTCQRTAEPDPATAGNAATAPVADNVAASAPAADRATVTLAPTQGNQTAGQVSFIVSDGTIRVTGQVTGLKPGSEHGFHVHEFGDCSAPDASSAGDHFNPSQKPHAAPGQGHDGAMHNLRADDQGNATVDDILPAKVNIGRGDDFDIVGHALIVHSDADDYVSQPVGNAGARLACGVIAAAH